MYVDLSRQGKAQRRKRMFSEIDKKNSKSFNMPEKDCLNLNNVPLDMNGPSMIVESTDFCNSEFSNSDSGEMDTTLSEPSKTHSSCNDFLEQEPLSSDAGDSDEDHFYEQYHRLTESDILKKRINNWVITYNINHVALTALLCILKSHKCFETLPSDSRSLLNTPLNVNIVSLETGDYSHIGLEINLKRILEKVKENVSNIQLLINIDGLPLFKSSSKEFWPILGMVANIPSIKSVVFPIGIYCGNSKPKDCASFLSPFVNELKNLLREGLNINGKLMSVIIKGFICDSPAKSFILNIKGHTGYHSCTKCAQSGVWMHHRMTFPEFDAKARTNEAFLKQEDEDFHIGETVLTTVPCLDFIHSFPLDYMHLVCLGVVRSLVYLWLFGPVSTKLPSRVINSISAELIALKNNVPVEFNRKPRSLNEIKRWKATEFRQFLLYTGPVALKRAFKEYQSRYDHFLSLSISISILISPKFCVNEHYYKYATNLLRTFVKTTMNLYGNQYITYNMHGLLHLPDSINDFGPLDSSSAFPFENFLQLFKKFIRKGDKPLQQVVKRLNEMMLSDT